MKKIEKYIRNDKGSISSVVLATILFFIIVLSTAYTITSAVRKSQLRSEIIAKGVYEDDLYHIEEILNSLKNKTVKIPDGFYYVGGTVDSGLVISDNEADENKYEDQEIVGTNLQGNQWVWIPCTTDGSLQYKRTEWDVENDATADNPTLTRASKDELTLTDSSVTYSDTDIANGINATVSAEIVKQINAEKASIRKNGGYYIGRYEVGKAGTTAVVQANKEPYAEIKWSEAYNIAKGIGGGAEATTYLCSSYAWDTAINFIQNNSQFTDYATSRENMNENWKDKEVKGSSGNVIKSSGTPQRLSTGLTTPKCNIYDMGGNVTEFTTELNPGTSETVVIHGGEYDNFTLPAGQRWDIPAYNAYPSERFACHFIPKVDFISI